MSENYLVHSEVLSTVAECSNLSNEEFLELIQAWGEEKTAAILSLNDDHIESTLLTIIRAAGNEWETFRQSDAFIHETSPSSVPLFKALIEIDEKIREQNKTAVKLPSLPKAMNTRLADIYQEIDKDEAFKTRFEALENKSYEFKKEMEVVFNLLLLKLPVEMVYMYNGLRFPKNAKPEAVAHWRRYFPMYFNILQNLRLR